jgi:hypothetical protein
LGHSTATVALSAARVERLGLRIAMVHSARTTNKYADFLIAVETSILVIL